ncbi:CGNR zinc finger domain-containing protein [Pyxidicoccus sp. 3LG]
MSTTPAFLFLANDPALDFLNTQARDDGRDVEFLPDAHALVAWLRAAGLLAEAQAVPEQWLSGEAGRRLLEAAHGLRAAIREGVEALREERPLKPEVAEALNPFLGQPGEVLHAIVAEGRLAIEKRRDVHRAEGLLRPVAEAAAHLMAERDPRQLRRCGHPDCILLFLDTTKNRTRRWCSMATCGNRMKAQAHRERTHGA